MTESFRIISIIHYDRNIRFRSRRAVRIQGDQESSPPGKLYLLCGQCALSVWGQARGIRNRKGKGNHGITDTGRSTDHCRSLQYSHCRSHRLLSARLCHNRMPIVLLHRGLFSMSKYSDSFPYPQYR